MYALIYSKDYGGRKAGDVHLIGRGTFDPARHKMDVLEHIEIPEQSVSHLYVGDPPRLEATVDDLMLFSKDEIAAKETKAQAAADLAARGEATEETTVKALGERLSLIEKILGLA